MLVLAVAMGPCYFFSFYFTIKKMDIKTPGREDDGSAEVPSMDESASKKDAGSKKAGKVDKNAKYQIMGEKIVELVGADNIVKVDNCSTRLRLIVKDNTKATDAELKAIGTYGARRLGQEGLQIIIGTDVEAVADVVHDITHK